MKNKHLITSLGVAALLGSALSLPSTAQGTPGSINWSLIPLSEQYANMLLSSYGADADPCDATANIVARANIRGVQEDFGIAIGNCLNLVDPKEASECMEEACEEFLEGIEEALAQHEARLDLCQLLGGGPYDPEIEPEDFSPDIDNPLLPFVVGSTWTYHGLSDEGLEVIFVEVLDETIDIDGIECRVVRDTVTVDGELIEDTDDYYAQDEDGNVWYFGEISRNYEDGQLVDIEGSWWHGTEHAKAGIVMFADPQLDVTYRQEFLLDEAEDAGTVLDLDATETVPDGGTYTGLLKTADFTPIEPDAIEHKYYAPGLGMILEVDPESGERVELVDHTTL